MTTTRLQKVLLEPYYVLIIFLTIMSNEIIPLFSSPVYKTKVDVSSISEFFLKTIEYEPYPDQTGYTSKDVHILMSQPFAELKKIIDHHMNMYCFELLKLANCRIRHTQSWVNLHKPGNYSPKHYHSNSCFSGGVYFKVPEKSGGLIFCASHTAPTYTTGTIKPLTSEGNLFNADRWGFEVEEGDLILWPSHLMHQTDFNESKEDRMMVAFNYFIDGKIGDNTRQLKIRVTEK